MIEKSQPELVIMARHTFGERCALCSNKFGGFIFDGMDYIQLGMEHCHVTKSRKEGGTKVDDFPGCTVCQRLQGQLPGMPLDVAQARMRQAHIARGYVFYVSVTGV